MRNTRKTKEEFIRAVEIVRQQILADEEKNKKESMDTAPLFYQHFVAKKLTKSNDMTNPLYQSCLKMDDDVAKNIAEALKD